MLATSETDGTGAVRSRNETCIRRLGVAVPRAGVEATLGRHGGDGGPTTIYPGAMTSGPERDPPEPSDLSDMLNAPDTPDTPNPPNLPDPTDLPEQPEPLDPPDKLQTPLVKNLL